MQKLTPKKIFQYYMIFIGIFGQMVFYAQAYKIFTTKSAQDVSQFGFTLGFISVASWLIYGCTIHDKPLIIANAIACVGAIAVLVGSFLYG